MFQCSRSGELEERTRWDINRVDAGVRWIGLILVINQFAMKISTL
jgi:hypothetical protein